MSENREHLDLPQPVEKEQFHHEAERARNPYRQELTNIAEQYCEHLRKLVPEGCTVSWGGSLSTQTLLKGHNEVDLRILLPHEWSSREGVESISSAIAATVPLQRVFPVLVPSGEKFALIHNLALNIEGIEGQVEIDVRVRPAEGFVEYEKLERTYPQEVIEECVLFKEKTRGDSEAYQKIKKQYRAMTRWLYEKNYWDSNGNIIGRPQDFEEAKKYFWGDTPEKVIGI